MTQSSLESERGRSLVVDTSACVAVILGEPGSQDLAACLEQALVRLMPAAIRVELGIVIEARLWPAGQDVVDRFLRDAKIDIVAVDEELAARAMSGWRRYGKGRHPAALNFGDCFTYALAERTGYPILCTGDDFAATGISVLRPPAGTGNDSFRHGLACFRPQTSRGTYSRGACFRRFVRLGLTAGPR